MMSIIIFDMKKHFIVLGILLPIALVGCGSNEANSSNGSSAAQSVSSNGSGVETPIPVTSVSLNKTSLEIYADDTDAALEATVLPENATNQNVIWSSSDTSVATVNDGKITPIKTGTTTITVKTEDGNKTATCALTVKEFVSIPNYVLHGLYNGETDWTDKQMIINPSSMSEYMIQGVSLHEGDLFKIHMYGDTWYGYSAVKTSTPSGLVAAGPTDDNIKVLATGVYDIYSNYDVSDGGHIYLARTDVTPPSGTVNVTGVKLNRSGLFMKYRDEQFTLVANVLPDNATNKNVSWSSSDESIAKVNASGVVTANRDSKKGSTTITAKTADGNYTATCIVYFSSRTPDYYLTGTIGGYSRGYGNYNFAGIPLSTGRYLIPDVELVAGDEITVTAANGAKLKDKYNHTYTYEVSSNMSVNVYLDINEANKNYLSFATK